MDCGRLQECRYNAQAANLPVEVRTFPGTSHAFFNDTGASYNPTAAAEAYAAVLAWYARYLA